MTSRVHFGGERRVPTALLDRLATGGIAVARFRHPDHSIGDAARLDTAILHAQIASPSPSISQQDDPA